MEQRDILSPRPGSLTAEQVVERLAAADAPAATPILDTIVLALYAAPTSFPYHEETADVPSLPDARRRVFHPDI